MNIITRVIDYDLGLPESGILVWHINEPINSIENGINNNPYNRAVSIEEADGVLDIGFESYALFSNQDPTAGTRWDLWYQENEAYHAANDINHKCFDPTTFNTYPPSPGLSPIIVLIPYLINSVAMC